MTKTQEKVYELFNEFRIKLNQVYDVPFDLYETLNGVEDYITKEKPKA